MLSQPSQIVLVQLNDSTLQAGRIVRRKLQFCASLLFLFLFFFFNKDFIEVSTQKTHDLVKALTVRYPLVSSLGMILNVRFQDQVNRQ